MKRPAVAPVIYLDTCAVLAVRSYLDEAKQRKWWPYSEAQQPTAPPRSAQMVPGYEEQLRKGYAVMAYLLKRSTDECVVVVSWVVRTEAIRVLTLGGVYRSMASCFALPTPKLRRIEEGNMVRGWMTQEEVGRLPKCLDDCLDDIKTHTQVDLRQQSQRDRRQDEALGCVEIVLSHRFMDLGDAWLLAEALTEQAEEVITFDTDFRLVLERLRQPASAPDDERALYRRMKEEVQTKLGEMLGRGDTPGGVVLPKACKLDMPKMSELECMQRAISSKAQGSDAPTA